MDLYLASGNAHKVREFETLRSATPGDLAAKLRLHSARELGGMPPVIEDTGSFEGNALKKAAALLALLPPGAWALSDDSGVCVDALNGGPGVESAYFAGPQSDPAANLAKLVDVMRGVPADKRGARFLCVLCLLRPGAEPFFAQGVCEGSLLEEPRHGGGFGYDPLFVPHGQTQSFAQLGDAFKNQFSHRARAWRALASKLGELRDPSSS